MCVYSCLKKYNLFLIILKYNNLLEINYALLYTYNLNQPRFV